MSAAVTEVAPGCWAWMRLPGGWGQTNIGLVHGEGASLLIDTPWDRPLTRAMLAAFADATGLPPIALVFNTHPDPDHWWGNSEVPGAEVLSSAAAADAMRAEATPERLAGLARIAGVASRVPGRPGRTGRYVAGMLAPFDLGDIRLRLPERTFTGVREETVGGRTVRFIDFGAAHTASDSVVLVPDARVAYTGDLLFNEVTPVMWHGPVTSWLESLRSILALEADTFVPGHGPVSTRSGLRAVERYWTWVSASVAEERQAGRSPMEMCERMVRTPEFAAFAGWKNPERLYVNVATIDRQLAGKGPIPANPIARGRAFDGVATLCHHLHR
jgi:cyclase